ncbi:MAG: DMT family transporter [Acidimicrobiia bacterium]|nr:DMT family transporter [Acidimicrobiia bacterium]
MTHLAGLAGVSAISFAAIFVRYAGTAPGTTTFFRALYALPFLVIAWLLVKGRDTRPRQVRLMAVAAGTFLAIDLTIWHVSIDAIGAGLATVLANTQIVFVGLFAWLISGEKPSRRNLLVAPVIFTGVVLISGLGDAASYGDDPLLGAITGVIAGFFYGAFIFTLRRSSQGHDARRPDRCSTPRSEPSLLRWSSLRSSPPTSTSPSRGPPTAGSSHSAFSPREPVGC